MEFCGYLDPAAVFCILDRSQTINGLCPEELFPETPSVMAIKDLFGYLDIWDVRLASHAHEKRSAEHALDPVLKLIKTFARSEFFPIRFTQISFRIPFV